MLYVIDRSDSVISDLCDDFDGEYYLLQDEIDTFNKIIKWKSMWDLDDVRDRLSQGWKFVLFKPDNTIKGWGWLNVSNKEICNVYVNPLYRNKGIGVEIINSLHRHCQGYEKWWAQSDEWNKPAHQMFKNCNYKIIL